MAERFIRLISPNKSKPFSITLAGISYPDATYHIQRPNYHNIFCFEYVISGKGIVRTNGKEFCVSAGDSYMLLPENEHDYFSDPKDPMKKIWFNASGTLISALLDLYRLKKNTVFEQLDTSEYILKIHKIIQDRTLSPLEIQDKYTLLFHELLQYVKNNISKEQYSPAQKIRDFITQNAFDNISLTDLAKLIYRSESQVSRIFKEAYATTPYKFLLECKMNHAKNMLLSSNMSIKEIAEILSFSDEHYFSNIFKEKIGVSPKNYRNQNTTERKIYQACDLLLTSSLSVTEVASAFRFPSEAYFIDIFTKHMGMTPLEYRIKNQSKEI